MEKNLDISVEEFASPIQAYAESEMKIDELQKKMEEGGYRHLPVLENKCAIGMISIRDINLIKSLDQHFDLRAKDIMSADPYCTSLKSSLGDVAFHMSENKIGSAILTDAQGNADSIFTSIDGLNALVEITRGEV